MSDFHRTFERICPGCNVTFLATRRDTLYCSNSCRQFVYRSSTSKVQPSVINSKGLAQTNQEHLLLLNENKELRKSNADLKKSLDKADESMKRFLEEIEILEAKLEKYEKKGK